MGRSEVHGSTAARGHGLHCFGAGRFSPARSQTIGGFLAASLAVRVLHSDRISPLGIQASPTTLCCVHCRAVPYLSGGVLRDPDFMGDQLPPSHCAAASFDGGSASRKDNSQTEGTAM